jgi:hypothetical protein
MTLSRNAQALRFIVLSALMLPVLSARAETLSLAAEKAASTCADLGKQTIAASEMALPTNGASVSSATFVPAAPTLASATPPAAANYCKVLRAIAPVDPSAPAINFQLNLPADWNGKVVHYGGGGFNGVLITGLDPLRDAPPTQATPLAQGFVTVGTDSGHQNQQGIDIQAFALNDEALENFSYALYKKVRDAAVALMKPITAEVRRAAISSVAPRVAAKASP